MVLPPLINVVIDQHHNTYKLGIYVNLYIELLFARTKRFAVIIWKRFTDLKLAQF